jgi:hypothetical protein
MEIDRQEIHPDDTLGHTVVFAQWSPPRRIAL